MTFSQFYIDKLATKKISLKSIKNEILQDFKEQGDLVVIVSNSKELGYLLKNNPKFVTHIKIWIISLKLYLLVKLAKIKVKTNVNGS